MKRTLVRVLGAVFVLISIPFYMLASTLSPAQTAILILALAVVLTGAGIYLLIHPGVILLRKRTTSKPPPRTSSSSNGQSGSS